MKGLYRHYKGGIYEVIGKGFHTETKEHLVLYKDSEGNLWVRPVEMFLSPVEVNGVETPRFEKTNQKVLRSNVDVSRKTSTD